MLTVKKAAMGVNKQGEAVLLFELASPITERFTTKNKLEASVIQQIQLMKMEAR